MPFISRSFALLVQISPLFLTLALLFSLSACEMDADKKMTRYQSGDRAVDQHVEVLLEKMTVAEKVGQLNQFNGGWYSTGPIAADNEYNNKRVKGLRDGAVGSMLNVVSVAATREAQRIAVEESRLGIPLMFAYDVIHGYQTMFPIPLGEAASWDLEMIERNARIAAVESSAAGLHWTFAPMVDIGRDARFGRVMEGAGEDPYLGAQVAVARVKGFQGNDLADDNSIAATAKHFAGYGFVEAGRDYNTVDVSNSTLWNVILPPFKAAAEAGVATFMNAFNDFDGVPATGSHYLQNTILKQQWDFPGLVVSDWDSIGEMEEHGYSRDLADAARQAINAGNDIDMESAAYLDHLAALIESGEVSEQTFENAVRRVLRLKFALGLFDDPFRYADEEREQRLVGHADHHAAARDAARKSAVLLKNANQILPLDRADQTIAVIGPLANDKDSPLGNWRAMAVAQSAVSLLEGVRSAVVDDDRVLYAEGAALVTGPRAFASYLTLNEEDRSGFANALAAAEQADVVIMALGEDAYQSGEGRSRTTLDLTGLQQELFDAVAAVNDRIVLVLMTGRPLVIGDLADRSAAVLQAWHAGSQAGHGLADVLFGDYNPSGKLPMSFPHNVGQLPLYYNQKNTGRPGPGGDVFWSRYADAPNEALYPFGYGLSYTSFEYSDLALTQSTLPLGEPVAVTVQLTNSGAHAGSEVVQLYIRDRVASTIRPLKELKGFQKVSLAAGETQQLRFILGSDELGFYSGDGRFQIEPGSFDVFVGGNSVDTLQTSFEWLEVE